jgi:hypothetical protein
VFIYQNKIINGGKYHINSLYHSWIANSCDGDTALSEHVAKVRNRTLTAVMCSSGDDSIQ